jgi:hypothetical protein
MDFTPNTYGCSVATYGYYSQYLWAIPTTVVWKASYIDIREDYPWVLILRIPTYLGAVCYIHTCLAIALSLTIAPCSDTGYLTRKILSHVS